MNDVVLDVKDLRTYFFTRWGVVKAVDGVSFCCRPGQVYGLLGANGAGKTTTLRVLATILAPSKGAARVAGYDVIREPEKVRHSIGFLSTATALYGRLTARELVTYFGRLHGMTEHRLHRTQIGAVFQQVRSKGVPQGVGRDVAADPSLPRTALDNLPEALACQSLSGAIEKDEDGGAGPVETAPRRRQSSSPVSGSRRMISPRP